MSDLIRREDAIRATDECFALLARLRVTARKALEAVPSADTDISEYSAKLWKTAYERGKADRPQEWIPCSERLPEEKKGVYLICAEDGYICSCRWTNVNPFWTDLTTEWHWCIFDIPQYSKVVAWMPLKPWKGADDEVD